MDVEMTYEIYLVILIPIAFLCYTVYWFYRHGGQKTRNPQQRRIYGSRQRPSLAQQEPTIYVSPANMPPPPKYEAMAPPSYEEVVGVHSPYYQASRNQPITQPITTAMAESSNSTENRDSTIITVTTNVEPRRTSVVVASSAS